MTPDEEIDAILNGANASAAPPEEESLYDRAVNGLTSWWENRDKNGGSGYYADNGGRMNSAEGVLEAVAAGGVNGVAGHYVKAAGSGAEALGTSAVNDVIAPYREWDEKARAGAPIAYMISDFIGSQFDPINKLTKPLGMLQAGSKTKAAANIATQGAIASADSSIREFGDTGTLEDANLTEGMIAALLSAPFSGVAMTAERSALRNGTPEARKIRQDLRNDERMMSVGANTNDIDNLRQDPKKFEAVLAEADRIAAARGGVPSVPQMGKSIDQAIDEAQALKDKAAAALARDGATVDPGDVESYLRNVVRERHPGYSMDLPLESDTVGRMDKIADRYGQMPRQMITPDEIELGAIPDPSPPQAPTRAVPPPLPPRSTATPPPLPPREDPVGALASLAARDAELANPGAALDELGLADDLAQHQPIDEMDLAPARPAARATPQVPPPPPPPPRPSARAPARQMISRSNVPEAPPDPVGALAARGEAPPPPDDMGALMEEDMLPYLEESPGLQSPDQLIEQDAMDQLERAGNDFQVPRPSARFQEPPMGPDYGPLQQPVSARAAPLPGPEYNAIQLPPEPPPRQFPPAPEPPMPQQPSAQPPPLPPPAPEEFVLGQPMPQQVEPGPHVPVPFDYFAGELSSAAKQGKINPLVPADPAAEFAKDRYAGIDRAMDIGAENADPALAAQWAGAKERQGYDEILGEFSSRAENRQSAPFWNRQDAGFGGVGSSLGAAIGTAIAPGIGTAIGGGLGLGAGWAAGRYYHPRQHAYQAKWLSEDTAARMEGIANTATPQRVGSNVAAVSDAKKRAKQQAKPKQGMPPGMTLGRQTTQSMIQFPEAFRKWADDFYKKGTDDGRAATVERLVRTNKEFDEQVYRPIIQGVEVA